MPSIIFTGAKPAKKQKRKSGWKQEAEQYQSWLNKHQPTPEQKKKLEAAKRSLAAKKSTTISGLGGLGNSLRFSQHRAEQEKAESAIAPSPASQPKIHDPRVLYKDNPEMLERELRARERKFNAAPVYNKGPDQYFSDDMMADMTKGLLRRR